MHPEIPTSQVEVPVKKKRSLLVVAVSALAVIIVGIFVISLFALCVFLRTGRTFSMAPFFVSFTDGKGAPATDRPSESFESAHPLANAMALVPEGVSLIQGAQAGPDWYWVVSSKYEPIDGYDAVLYQHWMVNIKTKVVKEVQRQSFGFPSVRFEFLPHELTDGRLEVRTLAGWEGLYEEFLDVFDGTSGDRIATLHYQNLNPNLLTELVGGPKHLVMLAPRNPCGEVTHDQDVTVTGLLVDDIHVPFKQPRKIRCQYSEIGGDGFAPDFGQVQFAKMFEEPRTMFATFAFPWGGGVKIDLAQSDSKQAVTIEE